MAWDDATSSHLPVCIVTSGYNGMTQDLTATKEALLYHQVAFQNNFLLKKENLLIPHYTCQQQGT